MILWAIKKLKMRLGMYHYTRVNCIQMDCNQAYDTEGTIDIMEYGIAECGYECRTYFVNHDRMNNLWMICYETDQFWPLVF